MKKNQNIVTFQGITTCTPKMIEMFDLVKRVAKTDSSVLLRGESGAGKELFARAIHNLSPRSSFDFQAVNCATLSKELMSSELFGHVKGAFTGATSDHKGVFEAAHKGTLFLDELAELSLDIQAQLLRALQERTFKKVGSTVCQSADVRFISATHQSLRNYVKQGLFREDLMYRIRVVPIYIPSLRERREDILILANHFLKMFNAVGIRHVKGFTKKAEEALHEYPFPGNIRELRNNVEYAFAVGEGDFIDLTDLSPELQGMDPPDEETFKTSERDMMLNALKQSFGNKGEAARLCNMSRATFWRKSKEHGLE